MSQDYIERIKKIKSEKKITTEELSEKTGIPVGTLSKFLAGISESVKLSNFVAIRASLNVSLDYIVSGTPENTNNFSLDFGEMRLIDSYRRLDDFGRDLVATVIEKERARVSAVPVSQFGVRGSAPSSESVLIAPGAAGRFRDSDAIRRQKRLISLYDLPVSAGPGEFLDSSHASETISIPDAGPGKRADYALRISGNSMEPKYRSGDVLLVENTDAVEVGDLCVYVLDGCGFFKQFGGDRLISLNPDYGPVMLKDYSSVTCAGRVIGKIHRK
jgi:SOS-response transcriptional repressor LexA/transcriptional regulator with XRE-family HTH domain